MLVYHNKNISQAYYGNTRISEIFLGDKKILGSKFAHLTVDNTELFLVGRVLYQKKSSGVKVLSRGIVDIMKSSIHNGGYCKLNESGFVSDTVSQSASLTCLSGEFEYVQGNYILYASYGLTPSNQLGLASKYPINSVWDVPSDKLKKLDSGWALTETNELCSLVFAATGVGKKVFRENVLDFSMSKYSYGNSLYLSANGEIRETTNTGLGDVRVVAKITPKNFRFIDNYSFVNDGFLCYITDDGIVQSSSGGFVDGFIYVGDGGLLEEGVTFGWGLKDKKICLIDGTPITGTPDNVIERTSDYYRTSDDRIYTLAGESLDNIHAELLLDLKEVQDA